MNYNNLDNPEKEFHNNRNAFFCFNKITFITRGLSHEEYIIRHYGYDIDIRNFFLNKFPRGYIKDNILHLYQGIDFKVPKTIPCGVLDLIEKFNIKSIHLGCVIGEPGETWLPLQIIKINNDSSI